MLQLSGTLHYKKLKNTSFTPRLPHHSQSFDFVSKDLFINYPDDMGIIVEKDYTIVMNHHLVETTLRKMFFEVKMEVDLRTIFYYELEKDVLFRVDVHLLNEKDVNRFIRKNKIQNLLQSNE